MKRKECILEGVLNKMNKERLINLARAYQEAQEYDYVQNGEFKGCSNYEVVDRIITEILKGG